MTKRSPWTKALHAVLLLAVAHQLLLVGFVEGPQDDSSGNAFFAWHRLVGLVTLGIVTTFWLWAIVRQSESAIGALFPWLSPPRLRSLWRDLRAHVNALRQSRLPYANKSALASATHGLGLLAVLAMAGSGAIMAVTGAFGGTVLQIHKLLANLMWAYVIAHAGIALLHQMRGHDVLQRMFGSRRG